ncbi:hypothetical protein [Herbiconiux daphne]|uniref:SIR2-like domain-containing protein n=1 Tax=Herbiconiux daphne TaxID=2970914 RepID=A0ABT2H5A6_9MICO|nr:hypothetical protein [Herbiconiux daphne]MCS5735094.1 hypothetical protein [Herbiconiux daphne]
MAHQIVAPTSPRTAYVLGAGFSLAASAAMPTTDELGRRAAASLGLEDLPDFRPDGITFENWLTWLAERQPFLSEAEHLQDRARFAELSEAIAIEVAASQVAADTAGFPRWLGEFVDLLHWSQSTVVTLNYDTIVETTLTKSPRFGGDSAISSADVVTGFPNGRGLMFGSGPYFEDRPTFRLHKLHGSIDWFAVPGDHTGATLERIPMVESRGQSVHRATVGGREVFIVPPTSTKGTYFDNPKTRFTWQQARDGLREAERIVLMGYSLPLTDTALARLLMTTIGPAATQEVIVVNPDAVAVANRLVALGVDARRIRAYEGFTCVQDFIDDEVKAASSELVEYLTGLASSAPDNPVAIGWGFVEWGAVTGATFDAATGTLRLAVDRVDQPLGTIHHPDAVSDDPNVRRTMTLGELLALGRPSGIVVEVDGREWRMATRALPTAGEEPDWVLLRPLGHQPDRRP